MEAERMAYDKELYTLVEQEYEEIRRHDEEDMQERRHAVFEQVPEVEAVDDEIKSAGLKIVKLALDCPSDMKERIALLRDRQKALLIRRKSLLLENGFAEDELGMRYMCDKCKDTGVYQDRNCECFRRRLILKAFEQSNLSMQLRDQSFKTFDLSLYSRETDPAFGISPYEHMANVVNICRQFVSEFEAEEKSLLFWGKPGLGKTFLSTCIAKELMKKSCSVIYETAYHIFSMLEDYQFKRTDDIDGLKARTDKLYECDLLIMDDLGTEFSTGYTNAAFFNIINTRLIQNKKTIINTNLSMAELAKRYSERVVSRLAGNYRILQFIGRDIRLKEQE